MVDRAERGWGLSEKGKGIKPQTKLTATDNSVVMSEGREWGK